VLPTAVKQRIDAIQADNRTGASQLALDAAAAIGLLANENTADDERFTALLEEAARSLIKAQPVMAPIVNLVDLILRESDTSTPSENLARRVARGCSEFATRIQEANASIRRKATALIRDGDTVLTHSFSSAVLSTLRAAHGQGRRLQVICTESRPVNEGVTLARELAAAGIRVRLIIDAAAPTFLPQTDVVLVGADGVTTHGLVNKTGTLGLALSASMHKTDLYALCGTAKFLPAAAPGLPQDARDPDEVLAAPPADITPVNNYFDVTPLTYCTGLVTETGVLQPEQVEQRLLSMPVHPLLATFLAG